MFANKYVIQHTLAPGDYDSQDYDLLAIMT